MPFPAARPHPTHGRSLLGDFDLEGIYQFLELGTPAHVILPMLLFVYTFTATILLVNLLIAQMSATYDDVRLRSELYWQFERVALIKDYKACAAAPPPPAPPAPHGTPHLLGLHRPAPA